MSLRDQPSTTRSAGRRPSAAGLPPAMQGERHALRVEGMRMVFYAHALTAPAARPERPLLLVHSINAAASACEVRPLFDHYRGRRPVYAADLPGFGLSERSDRAYTPRLMIAAINALADEARREHAGMAPDVIALSLSSEFVARAALESPGRYRSLALVSPTGFDRRTPRDAPAGQTRDMPWLRSTLLRPLRSERVFRSMMRPAVVRLFLRKTWGSNQIDEHMARYAWATAQQPGAPYAPIHFVSGSMFSADARVVYRALELPVWLVHGTRGDFVDYRHVTDIQARANWAIDVMDTGAFPHFEQRDAFVARYEAFLQAVDDAQATGAGAPVGQGR